MNRRPRGLCQSREHGFQDLSKPVLSLEVSGGENTEMLLELKLEVFQVSKNI